MCGVVGELPPSLTGVADVTGMSEGDAGMAQASALQPEIGS